VVRRLARNNVGTLRLTHSRGGPIGRSSFGGRRGGRRRSIRPLASYGWRERPDRNCAAITAMRASGKQQPRHVGPRQAAGLDGIEPVKMVANNPRQLLSTAAGQHHVLGNRLGTSFDLLVCQHPDNPCDIVLHIGTHFDFCKSLQNNASLLNRNAEESRRLKTSHLCIWRCA